MEKTVTFGQKVQKAFLFIGNRFLHKFFFIRKVGVIRCHYPHRFRH